MKTLEKGTPILIHLVTTREQDGEVSEYEKKFSGQIFQIGNSLYLRYVETQAPEKVIVTFKIIDQNSIQLTRKRSDLKLRLFFEDNHRVAAAYQTSYGVIPIETVTPHLQILLQQSPLAGAIKIDYLLYNGLELLGKYKIRLQFTT
ncbi:YwiB family protein [Liquorilactobacillus nagelii]|uniref:DUF1934 domain-containing protein n=1 Tax=Liquorilactobacillus nagelii TaxID=82688 RepID=A0A3S6QYA0_9LACO|nr:DUF1934 domain-containing protein [Liquorilactobacillus nagelii]AUJ33151.1 hypothetical protein BSQ50_01855 [Liquorilactobacillus nagelii]KRL41263.1 hypothetical protein FD45_GL001083 [Liquorilactobacillus nagelii DSM 13675]MCI1700139.1 DUF1934 domain-containing protein [Liquorilactobacillus nagelii]